jgi:glycopeptide antibiotics resistance protein
VRRPSLLWLTVAAIVAATFPWDLRDHPHWQKVAWIPFATGIVRPTDLLLNVALYVPFGFLLAPRMRRAPIVSTLVGALALSSLMELTQVWSHVRFPSATDIVMNVLGAALGAALARA